MLAVVLLIGAAAPLRAWCEAKCLAPTAASESHCGHEAATDTTAISATLFDECPVLESARPIVPARLEVTAIVAAVVAPPTQVRVHAPPSSIRPHSSTVFERNTPLRI